MNEKKPETPKSASGNEGAHQQSEAPESHQQTMKKQKSNAGNINNAALQTVQAEPTQQAVPVQPVQQAVPVQPVQQTAPVQPVQQAAPVQPTQQIDFNNLRLTSISDSQIIEAGTNDALLDITSQLKSVCNMHPTLVSALVLGHINNLVDIENQRFGRIGKKHSSYLDLPPRAVAKIIAKRDDIALIAAQNRPVKTEERYNLPIARYNSGRDSATAFNKGIYEIMPSASGTFGALVEEYYPCAKAHEKQEIFNMVHTLARIAYRTTAPHLVPVLNGVYDMEKQLLYPYSPKFVYIAKIHTAFNPNAQNPHIPIKEDGSIFDVDTWLSELGDKEFVLSIIEIIQALCTPFVPRGKMVLFFSTSGCNAKGTLCALFRNLIGPEYCASISLDEFNKPFSLGSLDQYFAIITDENDVGVYVNGLAKLKAIITGDPIMVEQKYEKAYYTSFHGLVIQCVNSLPKISDKSGSFKRRLHFVKFESTFTGKEKKYIKSDMVYRQDVLEYILKLALTMPLKYSFTETTATKKMLRQYELTSDSVANFVDEIIPQTRWNFLPATDYLYVIYKCWYKETSPSGRVIGRNEFLEELKTSMANQFGTQWEWKDSVRTASYLNQWSDCDPLFQQYRYNFEIEFTTKIPHFKQKCSGFVRKQCISSAQSLEKPAASEQQESQQS